MKVSQVLQGDGFLSQLKFGEPTVRKDSIEIEFEQLLDENRLKARVLGLAKKNLSPREVSNVTVDRGKIIVKLKPENDE